MTRIQNIRMSNELKDMLRDTASKCKLTESEVLRIVARGICRNRPVVQIDIPKGATASGPRVIDVRGGGLVPDNCTADDFRRILYARCFEELSRPEKEDFKPKEREGIDYNVPDGFIATANIFNFEG